MLNIVSAEMFFTRSLMIVYSQSYCRNCVFLPHLTWPAVACVNCFRIECNIGTVQMQSTWTTLGVFDPVIIMIEVKLSGHIASGWVHASWQPFIIFYFIYTSAMIWPDHLWLWDGKYKPFKNITFVCSTKDCLGVNLFHYSRLLRVCFGPYV